MLARVGKCTKAPHFKAKDIFEGKNDRFLDSRVLVIVDKRGHRIFLALSTVTCDSKQMDLSCAFETSFALKCGAFVHFPILLLALHVEKSCCYSTVCELKVLRTSRIADFDESRWLRRDACCDAVKQVLCCLVLSV